MTSSLKVQETRNTLPRKHEKGRAWQIYKHQENLAKLGKKQVVKSCRDPLPPTHQPRRGNSTQVQARTAPSPFQLAVRGFQSRRARHQHFSPCPQTPSYTGSLHPPKQWFSPGTLPLGIQPWKLFLPQLLDWRLYPVRDLRTAHHTCSPATWAL